MSFQLFGGKRRNILLKTDFPQFKGVLTVLFAHPKSFIFFGGPSKR